MNYCAYQNSDKHGPPWELGLWEITFIIAGPIFVLCVCVVMVFFYLWQKKNINKHYQNQRDPLMEKYLISCPENDPSGPSLKDLFEMTTSGSGSGKTLLLFNHLSDSFHGDIRMCLKIWDNRWTYYLRDLLACKIELVISFGILRISCFGLTT